ARGGVVGPLAGHASRAARRRRAADADLLATVAGHAARARRGAARGRARLRRVRAAARAVGDDQELGAGGGGYAVMATAEAAQQFNGGQKEAGVDFVVAVPDINLLELMKALAADKDIEYTPVGREEEGIGICTGGALTGHRVAMLMQNGGFLNSCNGLTTTALQFGIPMLLLVYYAGDWGDSAFH